MSDLFDNAQTIDEVLGLAVGGGSTCWEHMAGTGVFLSHEANEIVAAASQRINKLLLMGEMRTEYLATQCECEAPTRGGFHQPPCSIPNIDKNLMTGANSADIQARR